MDEKQATEILNNGDTTIENDGSLDNLGWYLSWHTGNEFATLDGEFTANELEAITWWMKKK